jgi:hypothetical protein
MEIIKHHKVSTDADVQQHIPKRRRTRGIELLILAENYFDSEEYRNSFEPEGTINGTYIIPLAVIYRIIRKTDIPTNEKLIEIINKVASNYSIEVIKHIDDKKRYNMWGEDITDDWEIDFCAKEAKK